MEWTDVPMFSIDASPPPPSPKRTTGNTKPVWSRYKVKAPLKCDDCMFLLALAKGKAPVARFALFRRKQGKTDLLLCGVHAQYRRDEDGLRAFTP